MDLKAWIDRHDAWITDTIRRPGWAMQHRGSDPLPAPSTA
jgi:hypothetical protein